MIRSPAELQQEKHDEIAAQIAAYLASGKTIEVVPIGAGVDALLTPYQRINPDVRTRATIEEQERRAKKAQSVSYAAPKPPKVRKERPPKAPKLARPGTHKARILEALSAAPRTSAELAAHIGTSRNATNVALADLRDRGLIRSEKLRRNTRVLQWKVAA